MYTGTEFVTEALKSSPVAANATHAGWSGVKEFLLNMTRTCMHVCILSLFLRSQHSNFKRCRVKCDLWDYWPKRSSKKRNGNSIK